MGDANNRETKLAALKARIVPVAKSGVLLAVARELEELGLDLAHEERTQAADDVWPRDLNERSTKTTTEWGRDPAGDVDG